ncbi:MAG: MarR family winged helix-turn-helix transcriptional regulator [Oscillospiraceae bacterium]
MITINSEMKRFNHLTSEINAAYHEASVKLGISDSAMQILYTVNSCGSSCQISDVCRLTGISKQTINSALRRLEQEDIIRLEKSGGRNKRIILTQKGLALSERTVIKIIGIENRIFDSWTEEKRALYLSLTQDYLDMFREQIEQLDLSENNT